MSRWALAFKILVILGILTEWSTKAMANGKITATEASDLGIKVATALGLPTSVDVPTEISGAGEEEGKPYTSHK